MIQELDLRKNYTRYNGIVAIQQAARKDDLETFVHLWDECHEEVEKDQVIDKPAWISNYIHFKVWDEIPYPFLNFNGCTVEV